jgi:hypothetical protein
MSTDHVLEESGLKEDETRRCVTKSGGEKGGLVSRDSTPEKEESENRKKKCKKIATNSKTITRRVIAAGPRKARICGGFFVDEEKVLV